MSKTTILKSRYTRFSDKEKEIIAEQILMDKEILERINPLLIHETELRRLIKEEMKNVVEIDLLPLLNDKIDEYIDMLKGRIECIGECPTHNKLLEININGNKYYIFRDELGKETLYWKLLMNVIVYGKEENEEDDIW